MGYRDDQEALRERVSALESELAAANRKIAELSGTAPAVAGNDGETLGAPSALGAPRSLRTEKVVEGELSAKGYEAIAALIRERLQLDTAQVGGRMTTLTRPGVPMNRVEIAVRDGKTHLLLERTWAERSVGVWVFAFFFAMFGSVVAGALAHDVFHVSDAMSLAQVLWAGPLAFTIAALLFRPFARKNVEKELAVRRSAFAAMVQLAEGNRVESKQVRVAGAEVEEPTEEELGSESHDASLGIR
jgi:hypothetical protein